jgi:hypothetical protein
MKDRSAFKASLQRLAATPSLVRVLVQHEDMMTAAELRTVADSL